MRPYDPVVQQAGNSTFNYIRESFYGAGQDSFSKFPSQNQELWQGLTNVMPVAEGTFRLRHGYQLFNNPAIGTITQLGSYQNIAAGIRKLIYVSGTAVDVSAEDGTGLTSIITSTSSNPRFVLSRDYAYFSKVQASNLAATVNPHGDGKKWHSVQGATNWGIANGPAAPSTIGPNASTTVADGAEGFQVWTNPNNVKVNDGAEATNNVPGPGHGNSLKTTAYGFSVPAGDVITGILIEVKGSAPPLNMGVVKAGVYGITRPAGAPVGGFTPYGGSSDLWNTTWVPGDINAATFGAFVPDFLNVSGSPQNQGIDFIRITIYVLGGVSINSTAGAGNINLTVGRTYLATYGNSSSGHFSDLSLASASTGALVNKNVVLNVPYHGDSQVDVITILATLDGNDQTTLYKVGTLTNVPGSAGTTTTFTDNTPDGTLVLNQIYLNTDDIGIEHGVSFNSPPPVGMSFPTKHRGRIHGAVGESLYYSKSLDEVTTATGTVVGRPEESWPATNFIDTSMQKETIRGLLSDGTTLFIGTERHIWRLDGDGPLNFSKPEITYNEVGILNQDTWQICFAEGQPVGMIWFTPDNRVIMSNFATYQDIGTPIQDVLSSINSSASASWAQFFSRQEFDVYVLAIPTGANTSPDTLCVYDLRTGRWFVWSLADKISAGLMNITATGSIQWLLAASTGKVYQMLPSLTQDRVSDTPVSITSTMRTVWLHLGRPTEIKALNEVEVITGDANMLVTVTGASTTAEVATPLVVVTSGTLTASVRGFLKLFMAGNTSKSRYYQFTFVSSGGVQDILQGYNIEAVPFPY